MDSHWGTPNHRKRKRRRGPERPPILAHLTLDARLRGDVGYLSEDVFADLFPSHASTQVSSTNDGTETTILYAAIKPHLQSSLLRTESVPWTILPVRKSAATPSSKQDTRSTLRFSSSSTALQSFVGALQMVLPNRPSAGFQTGVDILILDVAPIRLDTIVISIDDVALRNLENANNDFHHASGSKRRGSKSGLEPHYSALKDRQTNGTKSESESQGHSHWEDAIRKALHQPKVVHNGDALPLPLPSHPITHVAPPPAFVEFCEPVSQGFLCPETKIVVLSYAKASKRSAPMARSSYVLPNGVVEEEEEEDTSNEQFYSAAEDKSDSPAAKRAPSASPLGSGSDSEDNDNSNDDDTDLSDSEGDTIGLNLPMLPTQSSGVFSAFSSATPRPGQFTGNGIATPGSVVSNFSTSTIRGGGPKGRLFETHGLLAPIPDEALHPKPPTDEDEEARVFVDTTSLVKIGCFSGDWVRIEVAPDSPLSALGLFGLNAFESREAPEEWRTVKIYALPGQPTSRPRYAIDRTGHRRQSISMPRYERPALKAYMSPLLLSNLGNPSNLNIAPLTPPQQHRSSVRGPPLKSRLTSQTLPPVAKEVTFMRLLTPIATEKSMDSSFHLGVRKFFESKQRIVKSGDLIGIAIDPELGRAVYQGSVGEEEQAYEELLSRVGTGANGAQNFGKMEVVWFKIGSVTPEATQEGVDRDEELSWGGVAVVKPGTTRMAQSGSEQGKVPDAIHNHWAFYLGAKRLPGSAELSSQPLPLLTAPKSYISQVRRRLRELISAATSPQAIYLGLPPVAILLTSTQRHVGKSRAATSACLDLGLHSFVIDCFNIINDAGGGGGDVKTAGLLEARAERAMTCGAQFTALLIQHVEVLTADRMAATLKQILGNTRVFIATTSDVENVPEGIRSLFTHEIEMNAPDEGEREGLLRDIVQDSGVPISADVDLASVALKTAALVAGDLVDVVGRASVARQDRLETLAKLSNQEALDEELRVTIRDIQIAGGESSRCIIKADFDVAVEAARKNFADAIGAPKIPNVTWDDVGGLTNVKDAVMETIQLPLERPELFAKGMKKRSGILFYGPPGTGKTLLAKAIATEFSLNFFSVKGPELLNMYIGESEANVRRVFQRARDARPCVVFFDELDSVAPKRGNQGDSGGVMDRIVSQLLAELDGMSNGEDGGGGVFVIGATNRPDLLDQALLRPGRFDKMLYLGVSDTHEKQLTILEALTRKFALHPSLSLPTIAESLPFTYTGADLYALCSDAMLKAITRRATSVDAKVRAVNAKRAASSPPQQAISVAHFFDHLATPDDTEVVVEEPDFMAAMEELVPSVSARELEHYDRVRQVFEKGEDKRDVLIGKPKVKTPLSRGNGKGKGPATLSADDEEFVLRTESLSLGDKVNGVSKSKGKAKAVLDVDENYGFGDASEGDEILYSP